MSIALQKLALTGGKPAFESALPVGQLNFPEWHRIEQVFAGIFDRRYYTNHGPLTEEFEGKLADFLGVRHAICMTNATIGLMIAAVALGLKGKVITPAFSFIATAQSLLWAGLEPIFCDVDPETHLITGDRVSALVSSDVCAVLPVHLWGNACDVDDLRRIADQHGIALYFDAAQAFGTEYSGRRLGSFGELEVFSFHATKVLSTMEGGCVSTNNDQLAARLRNIRSSYGSGPPVPIPYTGNGRFSEAQAAMGLLALEDFPEIQRRNRAYSQRYQTHLQKVPGIRFPSEAAGSVGNNQYVVFEVSEREFGLSRDELARVLEQENIKCRKYFKPGIHRCTPFKERFPQFIDSQPITDRLCETVLQVPSGQAVSLQAIDKICEIITIANRQSGDIRKFFRS